MVTLWLAVIIGFAVFVPCRHRLVGDS
jgi:hypothetical protein